MSGQACQASLGEDSTSQDSCQGEVEASDSQLGHSSRADGRVCACSECSTKAGNQRHEGLERSRESSSGT